MPELSIRYPSIPSQGERDTLMGYIKAEEAVRRPPYQMGVDVLESKRFGKITR